MLTRQKLPVLDPGRAAGAARGGYVLADVPDPQAILIGTGSEIHVALAARAQLESVGVAARVVSMPSWELFESQPERYRNSVLPAGITARVSIEAGATSGWERYTGASGRAIGLDRFGASAPYARLYEELGITPERAVEELLQLLT